MTNGNSMVHGRGGGEGSGGVVGRTQERGWGYSYRQANIVVCNPKGYGFLALLV